MSTLILVSNIQKISRTTSYIIINNDIFNATSTEYTVSNVDVNSRIKYSEDFYNPHLNQYIRFHDKISGILIMLIILDTCPFLLSKRNCFFGMHRCSNCKYPSDSKLLI